MTTTTTWDEKVRQTCRALVPPLLLATPSGWQLVDQEDDETNPGVAASSAAKERAVRNARAVVEWVEGEAPTKLQTLVDLVKEKQESDVSLQTKVLIAATAARFVTPRRITAARATKEAQALPSKTSNYNNSNNNIDNIGGDRAYSLHAWSSAERHLWTSSRNERLAQQVIDAPLLLSTTISQTSWHIDIVTELLSAYIRPLFSASTTNNVNSATGRARPHQNDGGSSAGTAPMEDEVLWKGGDVQGARKIRLLDGDTVLTSVATSSKDSGDLLSLRHAGLGSDGVFFVCCRSLAVMQNHTSNSQDAAAPKDDVWSEHWPLVLPPLMQLLEDPAPRFRLVGTQILSRTVLAPGGGAVDAEDEPNRQRQRRRVGTLLLRTGIAPLLRQALSTSMTFITARLAGALLQSTAQAWIRLIDVTTAELEYGDAARALHSHVEADGGRARYLGLSQLLDDAVLRVWAYAPSGMSASDLETEEEAVLTTIEDENDEDDEATVESTDVIDTTMMIVTRLTRADALGIGIVRYLDVTLEFLTPQLSGIEAKLKRIEQRSGEPRPTLSLIRETRAAQAIAAMLKASRTCPALAPWCARCITSAARCSLLLREGEKSGVIASAAATALQKYANDIVRAMQRAQSYESEAVLRQLIALDEAVFGPYASAFL